ncbi:hypothetical protein ACM61V_02165 [Sphingomonas sp. TX0543]|uniref:hypothetical protein n=1 Tax=unclassified Sphingomonas TaxID=196159 RepID=UPI0010F831FB|nr:hypothetical protein [Sphingomonas sp. 3P27F8]
MLMIFVLLVASLAIRKAPLLLVDIAATAIGIFIVWRCRVLATELIAQRGDNPAFTSFDARPTRRQRRLMARSLAWSLRRTEMASLLPLADARAERLVVA